MMLSKTLLALGLATLSCAKTTSSPSTSPTSDVVVVSDSRVISTLTGSITTSAFTGTYSNVNGTGQITLSTSTGASNATATSSGSQITRSTKSHSVIEIGGQTHSVSNGTATSTHSAALPSNTLPCNNYPELCNRKYSNVTEVCAHNSAFDKKNNAASNQDRSITRQLDDGVRMIQGETHLVNDTIYSCHTSCDLLNAGTFQSELETITAWVRQHPYDVVTILIANSDYNSAFVPDYVPSIENSGIKEFLYEPAYIPQHRDQWPTLGEMILNGKRVVMFMDYNANQTAVPYVIDQYTHMWETPYSPTNQSFPCTQDRPPNLSDDKAKNELMYLANHNLNTAIDVAAILGSGGAGGILGKRDALLLPDRPELNVTNSAKDEFGSLERTRLDCTAKWDHPPNFLVVDYYDVGTPGPGSVFEVAAKANGLTYNRECCGKTSGAASVRGGSVVALTAAVGLTAVLFA